MATIAQAAAHICCSRAQFDQYLAEGAVTRRGSGQYDLDEVRREAFAHLRSVAAGRGGAAGDKLTAERTALTAAKRRREERQDQLEAGQLARLAVVRRYLEQMLLGMRNRLLNLPGETAYMLAMRPRAECYEILDNAVRAALEEIADPAGAAARAAAAGVESKNGEVHGKDDNDSEEEDCAQDAVE
jgi:phage terminase Nu1 subunit (DNA packaging protein)